MGWQLIYTSSARCLKAGHSGFGTVARHRDMRDRLVEAIERASSYERGVIPAAPRIDSHRIVDIAGELYHVLSRIRDAGFDYSGRTNHIGHHVVFTAEEVEAADLSPADFLAGWRGWCASWNEPARYLGQDEMVELAGTGRTFKLPAQHWARCSGDAGFAASLSPETEIYLIVDPGREDDLLPLMGESMVLFGRVAWSIPFTTALKSNEKAEDYVWRGCWRGSRAEVVARSRGALVMDPAQSGSLGAPDAALAEYARTGVPPKSVAEPAAAILSVRRPPAVIGEPAAPALVPERAIRRQTDILAVQDQHEITPRDGPAPWRGIGLAVVPLVVVALLAVIVLGIFGSRISDGLSDSKPGAAGPSSRLSTPPAPVGAAKPPPIEDMGKPPPNEGVAKPSTGEVMAKKEDVAHPAVAREPRRTEARSRETTEAMSEAFLDDDWGKCPTVIAAAPFRTLDINIRDHPSLSPLLERLCDVLDATAAPGVLVATNDMTRAQPLKLQAKRSEERLRCYNDRGLFLTFEWTPPPRKFCAISASAGIPAICELRIESKANAGGEPVAIFVASSGQALLGRRPRSELHAGKTSVTIPSAGIGARLKMLFGSGDPILRSGERTASLVSNRWQGDLLFDIGGWSRARRTGDGPGTAPDGSDLTVLEALNKMRAEWGQDPITWDQIATEDKFAEELGGSIRGFVGSVKRHAGKFFEVPSNFDQMTRFGVAGDAWTQMGRFEMGTILRRTERAPKELERSTVDKWVAKQEAFNAALRLVQNELGGFRKRLEKRPAEESAPSDVNPRDMAGLRIELSPFGTTGQHTNVVLVEFE